MKGIVAVKLGMAMAGVLLAGTAFAQGPGEGVPGPGFGDHRPPFERAMGGDHGRWWNNPQVAERLKLTDAQRKAMDDTLQAHRESLVDLRGSLEKAELELEPMMKEDQPNESQILAQIDKVAQARAELEKANARFLLAIRGKLTPEQWKQMQADRASHPHPGWGRGGGPGGPGANGPGANGEGRGNWQRHGQTPPADGQAPPPAGPQSRMELAPGPDLPGAPEEGAGALQ
jgi:Spy/CpxP family protein refolding chaperone